MNKRKLDQEPKYTVLSSKSPKSEYWLHNVEVEIPSLSKTMKFDEVFIDQELSDSFLMPLSVYKELFNTKLEMKRRCIEQDYYLSDSTKKISYLYNTLITLRMEVPGKRKKQFEGNVAALSLMENATLTIGLVGMETMGLAFDDKMENLIHYDRKVVGRGFMNYHMKQMRKKMKK